MSDQVKPLRVAVVGLGMRGEYLSGLVAAPGSGAVLVALVDRIPQKAEWVKRERAIEGATVFAGVDALMAGCEFDAAIVSTGDAHHAEVVIPLLGAGCRVFTEKPLETTLEKCRRVIEADEAAGGRTYVGFNLRHAPFYATVKGLVDSGSIGRVLTIQADEFYDGGRTYFRRWNGLRKESGGLWITKASHDFDLLAWLAGRPATRVFASASRTYYVPRPGAGTRCRSCPLEASCPDRAPRTPHGLILTGEQHGGWPHDLCLYNTPSDTFDHGMAQVEFEGGIFATYTCNVVCGFTDRRLRISGERGTLEGHLGGSTIRRYGRDPASSEDIPVDVSGGGHGGSDPAMIRDFLAFARGERPPACRPREAAVAVAIGVAATQSGDRGRAVEFADLSE